jgi:CheY-like chemotaxis protein
MGMDEALRVLIVEDSMEDTFFIVRELQRAGYQVDFERVETQPAMEQALRASHWDLVISDYQMPSFNGDAALEVFRDSALPIPFIMVSGALGEKRVDEMLRAGAHDFVLKGNLARLAPAVRRELEAVRNRPGAASSEPPRAVS